MSKKIVSSVIILVLLLSLATGASAERMSNVVHQADAYGNQYALPDETTDSSQGICTPGLLPIIIRTNSRGLLVPGLWRFFKTPLLSIRIMQQTPCIPTVSISNAER